MSRLVVRCDKSELDWVKHAASLRGVSMSEYVKEAVCQQQLAALTAEREPETP